MTSAASPASVALDSLVVAVLGCSAVAAMSGGVLGEVATYLPGRRIVGVRETDELEIHVIGVYGPPVAEIDAQVRAAASPFAAGRPVSVHVDDLAAQLDATAPSVPDDAPLPEPLPPLVAQRGTSSAQS